jgi:purine nucleosidase
VIKIKKRQNYIHIDSDPFTDVDDALAITLARRICGDKVVGITTVHGDVKLRARGVKELLGLLDWDVEVAAGFEKSIDGGKVWWKGDEASYVTYAGDVREDAIDLLKENLSEYSGKIDLVSIAPMTNIAKLIEQEGEEIIKNLNSIYFMGKVKESVDGIGQRESKYIPNSLAHNVNVDVDAANIVFDVCEKYNVPVYVVPTELCKEHWFEQTDWELIRDSGCEWSKLLYVNSQDWISRSQYADQGVSYLYDPLVLFGAVFDGVFEFEQNKNVFVAKSFLFPDFSSYLIGRIVSN